MSPLIHQFIIHEAYLCIAHFVFTLFQYEQTRESASVSQHERGYRVRVRSNITRALTALDLTTVNDIQQTSAALAQCTVSRMRGRGGGKDRGQEKKNKTRKVGNSQEGKKKDEFYVCFPGGES